jgi:hypothetical protein
MKTKKHSVNQHLLEAHDEPTGMLCVLQAEAQGARLGH